MYQQRLLKAIPGGAHTYSRGYDQYPTNAPQILAGGKGAYVWDAQGHLATI
jgi:glutamate-1-semialdehyde 2,1-aminomutase